MKRSRIIPLIFALFCFVSLLAACGTKQTAPLNDAEPPSEQLDREDAVKVGILAPLRGAVSESGTHVRNGATLFLEQYNAQGGLDGKRVEWIEYDDEGAPEKTVTGYHYLLDSGVTAIIGGVTSESALAIASASNANRMPLLSPSATAPDLTYNAQTGYLYHNIFRTCFTNEIQGGKMASFAADALSATTAAIFYNEDSDYSKELQNAFAEAAGLAGLDVVIVEAYADNTTDFTAGLTRISEKEPEILFLPDQDAAAFSIAKRARELGISAILLGGDSWDTALSADTNPEPLEGSYYFSGYSTEETSGFLFDYVERYGETPNLFSAQGYDAAMILVSAMEAVSARQTLEIGSNAYRQALIAALKTTDLETATGHIRFDEYNNPIKEAFVMQIQNGQSELWGKY